MRTIPLVDIRADGPEQLVLANPDRAKDLIDASRRTFGALSDLACNLLLPHGDRLAADWLRRTSNPYRDEIQTIAAILNVPGVHAFNLCFEWGCTSGVFAKPEGPTLTRVLDWPFPRLGENIVIAHQRGVAGDFFNVTWPGLSGMFQGLAPGRFAATLNQAPMRRHRATYAGDWVQNRRLMFRSAGLPPAHLLRRVFEEAADYDEAKQLLATTPVALPVIYIIGGVVAGQGCVIERTENDHAIRPLEGDRVVAANHFETRLNGQGRGWRPRPIDSPGRAKQARALPLETVDERFAWFQAPIANDHSRLVLIASAGRGTVSVFGAFGDRRVTEIARAA